MTPHKTPVPFTPEGLNNVAESVVVLAKALQEALDRIAFLEGGSVA